MHNSEVIVDNSGTNWFLRVMKDDYAIGPAASLDGILIGIAIGAVLLVLTLLVYRRWPGTAVSWWGSFLIVGIWFGVALMAAALAGSNVTAVFLPALVGAFAVFGAAIRAVLSQER
ncbi:MAG: hypothetical protein AAF674_06500 [Pseudomonadota bacterium]